MNPPIIMKIRLRERSWTTQRLLYRYDPDTEHRRETCCAVGALCMAFGVPKEKLYDRIDVHELSDAMYHLLPKTLRDNVWLNEVTRANDQLDRRLVIKLMADKGVDFAWIDG
jgi:hypothetical protein